MINPSLVPFLSITFKACFINEGVAYACCLGCWKSLLKTFFLILRRCATILTSPLLYPFVSFKATTRKLRKIASCHKRRSQSRLSSISVPFPAHLRLSSGRPLFRPAGHPTESFKRQSATPFTVASKRWRVCSRPRPGSPGGSR